MGPAFTKGIREYLGSEPQNAHDQDGIEVAAIAGRQPKIVFDRYHVVAKANDAHLTAKQREQLTWLTLPSMQLKTVRAGRWRDDSGGFYDQPTLALAYLRRCCHGAKRSRVEPIKEFVRMARAHWDGIIAWQANQISNGLLEGTNSLFQAAKRRARYRRGSRHVVPVRAALHTTVDRRGPAAAACRRRPLVR